MDGLIKYGENCEYAVFIPFCIRKLRSYFKNENTEVNSRYSRLKNHMAFISYTGFINDKTNKMCIVKPYGNLILNDEESCPCIIGEYIYSGEIFSISAENFFNNFSLIFYETFSRYRIELIGRHDEIFIADPQGKREPLFRVRGQRTEIKPEILAIWI